MSAVIRVGAIEDEQDIVMLLTIAARMDESIEFVHLGSSLEEGLAALTTTVVDVLLLDRWLPDADALDHVTELRTSAGPAALVLLSAEVPLRARRPAGDVGLDGYLDKTVLADISRTPLSELLHRCTPVTA